MADNLIKLIFLLALSISLVSCQKSNSDNKSFEDLNYIVRISGLSLPDDAKILYRSESDRGGDKTFIYRIIYSKNQFDIKGHKIVRVSTKSAYKSIRASLKNIDIGLPAEFFLTHRWINEDGEWYGIWLKTSKGFYLDLEQVTTNENLSGYQIEEE